MPIDFSGVNLEGIDAPEGNAGKQPEADLSGVDFTGVDLSGVDFSGIDLSGAAAPDAKPERKEIDYSDDDSAITRGFKAGIDQTQAIAGGAIGLLGDKLGLESVRDYGLEVYNRNMDEAGENAPETNFLDIDSVGSAANWAGYALGNAAPMLAASLLGGGIGGIAAKALTKKGIERFVKEQVENGVEREVAEATAKKMAQTAVGQGSAAGAVASSFGMSAGSIYGDTKDADVAIAHGIVAGALDAFPVIRALRKAGVGEQAVEEISESVVSEIAKQGVAEGGTEAVQTFIEQHASFWVQQNESLLANLDEVNVDEIIEAAAMGGLAGGVMGGGGAAYRKLNEKATAASDSEIGRSSSDIEDLLAGDAPDSGDIELAEDGAIKLLGNDDVIYADEPADAKQARAEREEANRRAFEGQFSPKEQPVLEGEILGPSAELDEAQQPGIKLLGNDDVIYAEEAPDIKAKRLEREQVSREAFEGQFPAPDYERMNANIEQREVAAQQRRDAPLVRDLTAGIPTPVLEQVRAQGADERLAAPLYRDMLPKLAGDLIDNGGMGYITDEDGMIKGRAPSQNPDWFRNNGDIPSKGYVEKVVGKALNGDKLGSKEQRVLSAMLDAVDDERGRGNTADDLYEWESVMDLASLERAVDPSQPEVSLDSWAPDADDFFVELPDYDGGDLGQLATLWDQALVLGSTHDELKAIAESSANSEDMARGIYERIRQNIEATKADRGADRGSAEDNLAETSSDAPEIQGRADGEAGARSDAETYPQQDTPREQVESLDSQGLTPELQFPEAESNQEPVAPEGEAFGLTLYDEADLAERAEKESTADEAEAKAQIDRERELFSLDGGTESMAATAEKTQKPMAGDLFAGGSNSQSTQPKDFKPLTAKQAIDRALIRNEGEIDEFNALAAKRAEAGKDPFDSNIVALRNAEKAEAVDDSAKPDSDGGNTELADQLRKRYSYTGLPSEMFDFVANDPITDGESYQYDASKLPIETQGALKIFSRGSVGEVGGERFIVSFKSELPKKLQEEIGLYPAGESRDEIEAQLTPEQFRKTKRKSKLFRELTKKLYDPDPTSSFALSVYRGWLDAQSGRPIDRRYVTKRTPDMGSRGFNPVDGYLSGHETYTNGEPLQIRTVRAESKPISKPGNDGDANARELAESANAFPAQAKVGEAYMRAQSRGPITAEQASTIRDFYAGDEGMEKLKSLADSTADMSPGDRMQAVIDLAIAPEKAKAAAIDEAAAEAALSPTNDLPEPTEAQKEAGNYKKAKVRVLGREVTIENPKGSKRSGVDPDGNAWSVDMKTHYGYLNRTEGADGDHVDVFLGDNPDSEQVFVVDQVNADGSFDEHKVMVGFDSQEQAVEAYRGNYQDGWKVGPVTAMKADEFKAWLDTGDTTKPLSGEIKAGSEGAPAPVLAKSGNPFKNKRAAKSAATKAGLPDAEVVPVEGGFGYLSESKPSQESKASNGAASEPASSAATVANQGSGAQPEAKNIEDFGEVLTGARKHTAITFGKALSDGEIDVSAEPLSKSFPAPNTKKMADEGVSAKALAYVLLLRNTIGSKPRKSYRVQSWADDVERKRQLASEIIEKGDDFKPDYRLKGLDFRTDIPATAEALKDFPAELLGDAVKYRISGGSYSMFNGVSYSPSKTFWVIYDDKKRQVQFSQLGLPGEGTYFAESESEAIADYAARIRSLVEKKSSEPKRKKYTNVNVYMSRATGERYLAFKVRSSVIRLKGGFDSASEARAYLDEFREEIQAKIDEMRKGPTMRGDKNKPRQGDSLRDGDITPEIFSDAFGFRGVQFGNYVEGKRRQSDLNRAYDALMDLADAVGVPPAALSLNGELGLAFGARGRGGPRAAAAHYEASSVVINLTKNNGAGSLAHEWLHALDHYFGKQDGATGFMSENRKESGAARKEVREAWKGVRKAITGGSFSERSAEFDAARSKPYWNTTIEKAARAFERYMIDRLAEKGVANDYLANVDMTGGAYPTTEEMTEQGIRAAFDNLFNAIESKETEAGVMLYSRESAITGAGKPDGVSISDAQVEVDKFLSQYKGADDVTVRIFNNYKEAFGEEAPYRTRGGYSPKTDTLYLFAGEMDSAADLGETLRHEIFVHKGLGMVEPSQLKQLLDSLYATAKDSSELAEIVDEVERVESGRSDRVKAEEILARIAEEKPSFSDKVWNKLVLAIQRLMASIGIGSVSARRQGKDLVYSIGDAFNEGRRARPRADYDLDLGENNSTVGETDGDYQEAQLSFDFSDTREGEARSASEERNLAHARSGAASMLRGLNGTVLGNALVKEFKDRSAVSLIGKPIKSTEDLSVLGQIYRNPSFETLRYIFVKDGKVVRTAGVTSRMPGSASIFPDHVGKGASDGVKWLKGMMSESGADSYYMLHNHPSGNPEPSSADLNATKFVASEVPGLVGHVIVNHTTYSTIGPAGGSKANIPLSDEVLADVERQYTSEVRKPHDLLGHKITGPESVMAMADALSNPDNILVVGRGGKGGGVKLITELSPESLKGKSKGYLIAMLKKIMRESGSKDVLIASFPANDQKVRKLVIDGIEKGIILDGLADGKSSLRNSGIGPKTNKTFGGFYRGIEVNEGDGDYVVNEAAQPFTPPPEESWAQTMIRVWQDKFQPLLNLQRAIEKRNGRLPDEQNAYMAEELFHGKVEEDLKAVEQTNVKPLTDYLAENKIDLKELDLYLMAKHAGERNAYIASKREDMPDGGSGMTNAEADAILAGFDAEGKTPRLSEAADKVYAITRAQRRVFEVSGLMNPDEVAGWQDQYDFYVPLKGFAEGEKDATTPRRGRGFDIRGKESMKALGRRSMAESPTLHAIQDLTTAVIRYRKNEVGQRLLAMAEANPNQDYWQIFTNENPDMKMAEVDGVIQPVPVRNMVQLKDDYFAVKRDGVEYFIKLKDKRLHNAMQNLGPADLGKFVRYMGAATRYLSMVNTSLNPEFMVSNMARDIQTAVFNVLAEQDVEDGKIRGEALAADMVKGMPSAMKGIMRASFGKPARNDAEREIERYYRDFLADGAKTGYFDSKDIDGLEREVQQLIEISQGTTYGKFLSGKRKITDFVEKTNGAVENAIRLSAYIQARKAGEANPELGMTREQAASLAKNLTVNFNRKGEIGTLMNSLYMFTNASIQGTANFMRAIGTLDDSPLGKTLSNAYTGKKLNRAQKAAGVMMGASFALAALNRAFSEEDDDGVPFFDKVPGYVRERNLVLMKSVLGVGEPGEYWTIPLPYGYNVFYNMGDALESALNSDYQVRRDELLTGLAASFATSFNPIGWHQGGVAPSLAPSLLVPAVELDANTNFFGGPIYKENFAFGPQKADSALSFRSTKEIYKDISEWMNDATGGDTYIEGGIDVSPDTLEHLAEFALGGLYTFATRSYDSVERLLQDRDVPVRNVPFRRKVEGEVTPYADQSEFYDRVERVESLRAQRKELRGRERIEFGKKYGNELRLHESGKAARKQLSRLRRQRDRVESNESLSPKEMDERVERIERRMKRVVDRYNKRYNEAIAGD